jgi:acetyl esterase/lipase
MIKNKKGLVLISVIVVAVVILAVVMSFFYFQNSDRGSKISSAQMGRNTNYTLIENLSYDSDSPSQKLDLYLPKNVSGKIPVILDIHGGAFQAGDKYPSLNGQKFSQRGYAVAAVNYRLSGEAIFPAAARDVKSAVRWLRANANKYNFDSNHFGVIGASAGGHFSAFLGTTGNIKEFDVGDNLEYSSSVQAVIDQFGPVNFSNLNEQRIESGLRTNDVESYFLGCVNSSCDAAKIASPVNYISKNDPPFLIIHGAEDNQIPIKQSQDFYNALQNAGVESQFITVPNAGHGGPEFNNYFKEYLEFFNKHLK